jgi:hypothetical protein
MMQTRARVSLVLQETLRKGSEMVFQADQVSGGSRWPIVRIAAGGQTEVVVLSTAFLPLSVHWVGNSIVCPGSDCELCDLLPIRGLFYLPVMCNGRVSILELAAQSSSHLEMHCKMMHGGLKPGLVVQLSRRTKKSPIYSEVIEFRSGVRAIFHGQLASRVAAVYHLPCMNPDEEFDAYELRLQAMARARCNLAATKMRGPIAGVSDR